MNQTRSRRLRREFRPTLDCRLEERALLSATVSLGSGGTLRITEDAGIQNDSVYTTTSQNVVHVFVNSTETDFSAARVKRIVFDATPTTSTSQVSFLNDTILPIQVNAGNGTNLVDQEGRGTLIFQGATAGNNSVLDNGNGAALLVGGQGTNNFDLEGSGISFVFTDGASNVTFGAATKAAGVFVLDGTTNLDVQAGCVLVTVFGGTLNLAAQGGTTTVLEFGDSSVNIANEGGKVRVIDVGD